VKTQDPIIVKLVEPSELTGLADVLIGAIGLTGAIVLIAIVAGVAVAGLMFWWRSRSA
jgi:hypothetical protein